jgi:hypothetical protein
MKRPVYEWQENIAAIGEIKRKTKLKFFEVLTVPTYCRETDHMLRRKKIFFWL